MNQQLITLNVNGNVVQLDIDPETPLLYALRNDLGLKGPKYGCGLEQCNACKVLIDGNDVPSCQLPVAQLEESKIITLEGLGSVDTLHPLQEAFIEEQAIQCGYCVSGMIIAAQGLLNRTRYPSDEEIRQALDDNLCRCGVYDRVRRAIKLRIGRPVAEPLYEMRAAPHLSQPLDNRLSPSLQVTPQLDDWIQINADETVTVFTGKAELGQGIKTTIAQIAADELDVALDRIRVVSADTQRTPDEGTTAGSMSTEMSGRAVRQAAAEARQILLELAHEELESETPFAELVIADGTITDPATEQMISYWSLFANGKFGTAISGTVQTKDASQHHIVGQPVTRLDLAAKVTGEPSYVHDLALPGMLHGRIVRPPAYQARLISVDKSVADESVANGLSGIVKLVRDGSFLAVIAEREEGAIQACERLQESAIWSDSAELPGTDAIYDHLLTQPADAHWIVDGTSVTEPVPDDVLPSDAAQTLNATYHRPYQMHGTLGPSAAVAQWDADGVTIWSHTQGVYALQGCIAAVLNLEPEQIHIIHTEGAGCYGHNGADDVALDAALLARACPGRPVSVKWMREDEHRWEPYSSAMVIKLAASLDDHGDVAQWHHDVWSYPHSTRPRADGQQSSGLLAAWHLEKPTPPPVPKERIGARHMGGYRNADPLYAFDRRRIVSHFVPNSPLRISAMRSLGAYGNIFAIESFIDELAQAARVDPVEYRLRHLPNDLTGERAKAVILAAAEEAGWQLRTRPNDTGRGRGIAFAQYKNVQCYAAIVVEVTVDRDTGQIQLENVVIAADAGQIINPDGLSNQLEGGFVQAASWTLMEAVQFDKAHVISQDWESYPILHFTAMPKNIKTILLNRPDLPSLGSGEATQGPTPAAIANAVYDAVGVRLREIPFTPEQVLALM